MTGLPEFNFPAFRAGRDALRAAGHTVHCPAEHSESLGISVSGLSGSVEEIKEVNPHYSRRTLLAADLHWICTTAEAVVTLDDWNQSSGAAAEVAAARALPIPVYSMAEAIELGGAGE